MANWPDEGPFGVFPRNRLIWPQLSRPLLLIDVDGVLSLFGTGDGDLVGVLIDGVPHLLSRDAAAALRSVAEQFECVWCTGWEERADENLPRLLDLPRGWPHVPLGSAAAGPHWKLAGIDAYAGPARPLAWIDDNHGAACVDWAANRPGPTLLVSTEPHIGMTEAHARTLRAWAAEVAPSRR
jgi:hypothetical protein